MSDEINLRALQIFEAPKGRGRKKLSQPNNWNKTLQKSER